MSEVKAGETGKMHGGQLVRGKGIVIVSGPSAQKSPDALVANQRADRFARQNKMRQTRRLRLHWLIRSK